MYDVRCTMYDAKHNIFAENSSPLALELVPLQREEGPGVRRIRCTGCPCPPLAGVRGWRCLILTNDMKRDGCNKYEKRRMQSVSTWCNKLQ
jgi:hypothetical protein